MQKDKSWQSHVDVKNSTMLAWLNHAGSFMQRLDQYGIKNPIIDVLSEGWYEPEVWECELLRLKSDDLAWVREVCIFSDTRIWLYGRSVIPHAMLRDKQELSRLENRSLGSVLFQDANIKREDFQFIYIEPRNLWQNFLSVKEKEASWVRRSLFNLHDRSLLLSEILMPDLTTLCMKK